MVAHGLRQLRLCLQVAVMNYLGMYHALVAQNRFLALPISIPHFAAMNFPGMFNVLVAHLCLLALLISIPQIAAENFPEMEDV